MARGSVKTTRKKTSAGKAIDAFHQGLILGPYVKIGWPENKGRKKHEDSPLTVAEIATIHEFGAPEANIPERSMIRGNHAEKANSYGKMIAKMRTQIALQKYNTETALGLLGLKIVSDIKARIVSGIAPELKPETIRRKGSSTPLIDTGQMINSISHLVKMKGDEL